MIDFRYHVVTIVSIFLALAVGIVLGAGPLQSGLGEVLGDQVSQLRQDKADLNSQLSSTQSELRASREYAGSVSDIVVAGRLDGRTVAVVTLPNADAAVQSAVAAALTGSGAELTGTVAVAQTWFEAGTPATETAVSDAAQTLGLADDAGEDQVLATAIATTATGATAVPTPTPGATAGPSPTPSPAPGDGQDDTADGEVSQEAAVTALRQLVDGGLVSIDGEPTSRAEVVIVVSGGWTGTSESVDQRSEAVRALARALAGGSGATVVVADDATSSMSSTSVTSNAVAAVRADAQTRAVVTTVDHAREGRGPAVVVLAVASRLAGQVGQFGTSPGATAVMPTVAP